MGGCEIRARVERVIKLCVAPVSTIAWITEPLIVVGIIINDVLTILREGRPSRTSVNLLDETNNEVIYDQVDHKNNKQYHDENKLAYQVFAGIKHAVMPMDLQKN